MPDVAAEAGREADQRIQENKRNLLNGCQREFTNRGNRDGKDSNDENIKTHSKTREENSVDPLETGNVTTDHFVDDQPSLAGIYNEEPAYKESKMETGFDIPDTPNEQLVRSAEGLENVRAEETETPVQKKAEAFVGEETQEPDRSQREHAEDRKDVKKQEEPEKGDEIPTQTQDAASAPVNKVEEKHRMIHEQYNHVINVTKASEEDRPEKFKEYSEFLKERVGGELDKVKEQHPEVSKQTDKFREAFNERLDNFTDVSEKAYEGVTKLMQENPLIKAAADQVVDTASFVADPVKNTIEKGSELYNSVNDNLTETLDLMKNSESVMMKGMNEKDENESLDEIFEKVFNGKTEIGDNGSVEPMKDLSESINETFDGVKDVITGDKEQTQGGIEKIREGTGKFEQASKDVVMDFGFNVEELDPRTILQYNFADEVGDEDLKRESINKVIDSMKKTGQTVGEATKAVENAEKMRKVGEILKAAGKSALSYSTKVGISGMVGAAALSNPWSAAVFVAAQIVIRTVQYAKAQKNEQMREVTSALSDKETGSRATQGGAHTKATKETEALERG